MAGRYLCRRTGWRARVRLAAGLGSGAERGRAR